MCTGKEIISLDFASVKAGKNEEFTQLFLARAVCLMNQVLKNDFYVD